MILSPSRSLLLAGWLDLWIVDGCWIEFSRLSSFTSTIQFASHQQLIKQRTATHMQSMYDKEKPTRKRNKAKRQDNSDDDAMQSHTEN